MSTQDIHTAAPVDPAVEAFKSRVETFLVDHGMSPTRFGRTACNDSRFVIDLRNGRSPDYQTRVKVEAWMADFEAAAKGLAEAADNVPVIDMAGQRRAG